MVQKCNKVQPKHGNVTQNMHGASRNYRYVWDVSSGQTLCDSVTGIPIYIMRNKDKRAMRITDGL